jgi:hypothetical protein
MKRTQTRLYNLLKQTEENNAISEQTMQKYLSSVKFMEMWQEKLL